MLVTNTYSDAEPNSEPYTRTQHNTCANAAAHARTLRNSDTTAHTCTQHNACAHTEPDTEPDTSANADPTGPMAKCRGSAAGHGPGH